MFWGAVGEVLLVLEVTPFVVEAPLDGPLKDHLVTPLEGHLVAPLDGPLEDHYVAPLDAPLEDHMVAPLEGHLARVTIFVAVLLLHSGWEIALSVGLEEVPRYHLEQVAWGRICSWTTCWDTNHHH